MSAQIIAIAKRHLRGSISAVSCLSQASDHAAEGRDELAAKWALRSLAYSVGILHADYSKAFRLVFGRNVPVTLI